MADDKNVLNFKTAGMQRAGQRDAVAQKGKHFGIGNFFAWAMEKYPALTLGQLQDKMPSLEREYGQEKAMRKAQPDQAPTVSSAFDDENERLRAKGIKREAVVEDTDIPMTQCPKCGGKIVHVSESKGKKDACYHKVKRRYKVWPSAYASGALVQCRKKGAKNWGNKSKKK